MARDGLVPAWLVGSGPKLPWEMEAASRLPGILQLGVIMLIPGPVAPIARVTGKEELNRLGKEPLAARIVALRAAGRVMSGAFARGGRPCRRGGGPDQVGHVHPGS